MEALYTIFDLGYARQGRALSNILYQIQDQGNPEALCALSREIAQTVLTRIIELPDRKPSDAEQKITALTSMIDAGPYLSVNSEDARLFREQFVARSETSRALVAGRLYLGWGSRH